VAEVDFAYDAPRNRWRHPETGVVIDDEDMPAELVPDEPWAPIEAPTDSVTVSINVDLTEWLVMGRVVHTHLVWTGARVGVDPREATEAQNAAITDARDAYYTARDLTEEPR
jgi:hypothetical protein